MQHPFEGVLPAPEQVSTFPHAEPQPAAPRRAFLGRVLGAVGAFFGLQAVANAQFIPRGTVTTFALGEEGGGRVTTYALGEEGGGWRQPRQPLPPPYWRGGRRVTTYALGEEGGRLTTYALGEEGGGWYTTQALGEEGGGYVTTYALGEEG
jgi:hypothetical protein